MNSSGRLAERIMIGVGALCGVILLIHQSLYLFTYPIIDTGMWYGDESWTMFTLRTLASTGVARVPEALGSSLAMSNGFINGSVWIAGLLYGLPAHLLRSAASPVHIGRCITLLVLVLTLLVTILTLRTLRVGLAAQILAIFLLISTNAFFFSSHCARLDALTGFAVLLFLYFLLRAHAGGTPVGARNSFLIFFLAALSLSVYVHVPTLIALPAIYMFVATGGLVRGKSIIAGVLGGVAAIAVLAILYWSTTGHLSLLGEGYNQYYNVANSLPILHPFSWQVQRINTIDRFLQVWGIAPLFISAFLITGSIAIVRRSQLSNTQLAYIYMFLLVGVSWMLAEGPAIFYNIHILPVAAVALGIFANVTLATAKPTMIWIVCLVMIAWALFSFVDQHRRGSVGERLTKENTDAQAALTDTIRQERPLILTDQPAQDYIAAQQPLRLMTNHLLLFGDDPRPLPEILRVYGVRYLLLYSTHRWQSPFRQLADSLYDLIGERTGTLIDQAREYDRPVWQYLDTLRLYRAR